MRGRTVLTIAHRLATIRSADKIVVLKDGAVAEEGTYDALLQRGGLFAELYRKLNGRERIARFIDSTRKTLWVQNER
jgi:ABC-type multidrug transport system fused ATPase/permease subunit